MYVGKSFTLARRVTHMIEKKGTPPDNIIVFTITNNDVSVVVA
jgi:superfamily I DNA/RNA helicase